MEYGSKNYMPSEIITIFQNELLSMALKILRWATFKPVLQYLNSCSVKNLH